MNPKLQEWMFAALDGSINSDDFERLQTAMEQDVEVRRAYLNSVELFESLQEHQADRVEPLQRAAEVRGLNPVPSRRFYSWLAAVAALLLICSGLAFVIGRGTTKPNIASPRLAISPDTETMVAGHASLRRSLNVRWTDGSPAYQAGDLIPAGTLSIEAGTIELDFFCGASLVVQGPAELGVLSDWELTCSAGQLRAVVPPAARGFVINAADTKIVDLGTEFELQVSEGSVRVGVIDGEVELQQPATEPQRLTTGQEKWLAGDRDGSPPQTSLATLGELVTQQHLQQQQKMQRWQAAAETLRTDPRLVAYYPIDVDVDVEVDARRVANASPRGAAADGSLVGSVARVGGRFASDSDGLEFGRPGARVRVRLDGTFSAFTFVSWVKINSLQHVYNALFMADGYENGEPHWQIDKQGRLMFSVMVDDAAEVVYYSPLEEAMVRDAGRHRVYRTDPIWDISKSGRWMQLAAVYDPVAGRVRQYVDGQPISNVSIKPELLVKELHIGPAELGNWGQPFRNSPTFAVRNLDGTIDDLMIFDAALTAKELGTLYEQGKPIGY